jgi:hypothetical protein
MTPAASMIGTARRSWLVAHQADHQPGDHGHYIHPQLFAYKQHRGEGQDAQDQ